MFYVSHTVDEVARLADEIVLLRDGSVRCQGSVFDLLTSLEGEIEPVGAVIDARIDSHGEDLSVLVFDTGRLLVPRIAREVGVRVRVRLRAEDIMLAREEPRAISANNILPATIAAIARGPRQADIQLALGAARMVARITLASAKRLELAPGAHVFAIVKSVIVDSSQ